METMETATSINKSQELLYRRYMEQIEHIEEKKEHFKDEETKLINFKNEKNKLANEAKLLEKKLSEIEEAVEQIIDQEKDVREEWKNNQHDRALTDKFDSIVANLDDYCKDEKAVRDKMTHVYSTMNTIHVQIEQKFAVLIQLKEDIIAVKTDLAATMQALINVS